MGGEGYSVKADWQTLWNERFTEAQFDLMNEEVAAKINTVTTAFPETDVPSRFTNTAKAISDEMMMTFSIFLNESSMENPGEFIHYKLPHFTPLHNRLIKIINGVNSVGRIVS